MAAFPALDDRAVALYESTYVIRLRDIMRLLLAALLITLSLPAAAQMPSPVGDWTTTLDRDHGLVGRIWLPAEERFIDPAELAHRLATADFVLLGERHDNPDHHRLQAWSLAQIIAAGKKPLVAFEMISPEQAPALSQHLADHPRDVDGLAQAIDWANSHWPDWANYRPLFAEAMAANLPIRPANLAIDTLRTIARGQDLSPDQRRHYRLDEPLDPAVASALADEIRESHCGQLPERVVPGMVNVQRARDAAMAHAMADDSPTGAVLIAGAGHTRSDRGVPAQLATLAPGRTIFSLAFLEVSSDETDPMAYGEPMSAARPPFDAIWFTPRANDDDPCAQMIEFMKKKKEKEEKAKE